MLHVHAEKLGDMPDGGGRRYVGRAQGERHRSATAGTVLRRGVAWFAARGVETQRVLSNHGSGHRSHAGRDAWGQPVLPDLEAVAREQG